VEDGVDVDIEGDIEGEIEEASSVKQLKDIARTYDEFKSIREDLSFYKKADDLREYMLEILNPESVEKKVVVGTEEKEEPAKKKKPAAKKPTEKKPTEKKKPTAKKSTAKKTKKAVVEEMIGSKKGATIEEIAQKITDEGIDSDFEKNCKVVKLWLSKMGFDVKKAAIEKNPNFKK
jgi:hypothetical protein